jgi:hypothetical protein
MSMIAAAQWTAVATIGLAIFAVVTAVFASLAYRKPLRRPAVVCLTGGFRALATRYRAQLHRHKPR